MNEALQYFQEAIKTHSISEIARKIGLNSGTIKRWIEQDHVPKNYAADFARIIGAEYSIDNATRRDKDQFYTKPETAKTCLATLHKVMQELNINHEEYIYIEPAAGCGFFYNALPQNRRIGIDIDPNSKRLIKADFLKWKPDNKQKYNEKKYIVCGNPPFGLRGHLALQFINHAATFADVVGFILPPLFDSDGKGVPAKRVQQYQLAHSEKLNPNSFCYPNGEDIAINTIFQVWTKINRHLIKKPQIKTCASFISVYSLSDGGTPASTRNKNKIGNCDIYIPSTCFKGMRAYARFEDLPNRRGYGVIIHRHKKLLKNILFNHNWNLTAFASTNSAINIRKSLIENVVINGGFHD